MSRGVRTVDGREPPRRRRTATIMCACMSGARQAGGRIVDELAATGDLLFRWRSYFPLLLVPLFVLSVRPGTPPTPFAWELAAFAVALAGLLLRVLVIGFAPEGTSARGTRRPTAGVLATTGAYSILRHPLYVANSVMWIGAAMLSGTWFLPVIVALLSFVYHERIAAREEAFLDATFGEDFRAWARRVPAVVPGFGGYRPGSTPFQIRKVVVQESHGLFAIGTAFLVLDTLEDSIRLRRLQVDAVWLRVFAVTLVPFACVMLMKALSRGAKRT